MRIHALICVLLLGLSSVHVSATESCRVLVVVGMEDERAIAAGDGVEVVVGTANAKVLRERLNKVDTANISAVYSFGVAGGLDPALKPGDLLVSTQVVAQSTDTAHHIVEESWMADQDILMAIQLHPVKDDSVKIRKGVFLGTDFEARDNPQTNNQHLRAKSDADIIDNESHIAAKFAQEHNLPFVSVRAVSDSVSNKLPPAALIALDEDGSPNGKAIAKSLLQHPQQIPALIRTAWEYQKALHALKVFRRDIGFVQQSSCR
jgi:adenosylhomocysteine nucleosidase